MNHAFLTEITTVNRMDEQLKFMERCLFLAGKGFGQVAPNPMVGAVVVRNGEIIGEGYHEKFGHAHAEVNAIHSVQNKEYLKSSELYVNLEPCSHFGKTPPCADLIIRSGIPAVFVSTRDPNALVAGGGIEILKNAGIKTNVGLLSEQSLELNKRFFMFHQHHRPYVILKWAQTSDGFVGSHPGEPRLLVSGKEAEELSHTWRTQEQAILVGTRTAVQDNPRLTARRVIGKNPLRIVIDRNLIIPPLHHLFNDEADTLVITGKKKKKEGRVTFQDLEPQQFNPLVPQIMYLLYLREIQSVIVEGGAQTLNEFIQSGLWDEARVFVSETKLGKGVKAPVLKNKAIRHERVGEDELHWYQNQK